MLDFERTEQTLLPIGDWYTAKLYEAIQSELYLKDWKESVRSRLDNLAISWENLMDRIQLALWMLMLFGYLYLYMLDAGWITFPAN